MTPRELATWHLRRAIEDVRAIHHILDRNEADPFRGIFALEERHKRASFHLAARETVISLLACSPRASSEGRP
jgi:hypothetical protein